VAFKNRDGDGDACRRGTLTEMVGGRSPSGASAGKQAGRLSSEAVVRTIPIMATRLVIGDPEAGLSV